MAFLTIQGADYWVLEPNAEEGEPETAGESRRAIDGTLRKGERWYKRNFRFELEPLASAAFETLATATRSGLFLAVTGTAVPNGDYDVRVTRGSFVRASDTVVMRGASVALRRV